MGCILLTSRCLLRFSQAPHRRPSLLSHSLSLCAFNVTQASQDFFFFFFHLRASGICQNTRASFELCVPFTFKEQPLPPAPSAVFTKGGQQEPGARNYRVHGKIQMLSPVCGTEPQQGKTGSKSAGLGRCCACVQRSLFFCILSCFNATSFPAKCVFVCAIFF